MTAQACYRWERFTNHGQVRCRAEVACAEWDPSLNEAPYCWEKRDVVNVFLCCEAGDCEDRFVGILRNSNAVDGQRGQLEPHLVSDILRKLPYHLIRKQSDRFETYYRAQLVCPEEEWPEFLSTLRRDLPTVLRLSTSHFLYQESLGMLRSLAPVAQAVPWCCGAYTMPSSRFDLRRSPGQTKLKEWLVGQELIGAVSRQEVVSMFPALALDVQPGHRVLDGCASPGSKTRQLSDYLEGQGSLLAVEEQQIRAKNLCHRLSRCAACPNVAVLRADLRQLSLQDHFDRVLIDAPCSGDGTLRKDPSLWETWTDLEGPKHHFLQRELLMTGIRNLKPGGLLVYSTCSLNPIENEAVVAACLEASPGIRLEPTLLQRSGTQPHEIPGAAPGLSTWQTPCSFEELGPSALASPQVRESLTNCVRLLPHRFDSGAFFLATLRKDSLDSECNGYSSGEIDDSSAQETSGPRPITSLCRPRRLAALETYYGATLPSDMIAIDLSSSNPVHVCTQMLWETVSALPRNLGARILLCGAQLAKPERPDCGWTSQAGAVPWLACPGIGANLLARGRRTLQVGRTELASILKGNDLTVESEQSIALCKDGFILLTARKTGAAMAVPAKFEGGIVSADIERIQRKKTAQAVEHGLIADMLERLD